MYRFGMTIAAAAPVVSSVKSYGEYVNSGFGPAENVPVLPVSAQSPAKHAICGITEDFPIVSAEINLLLPMNL
jgi:hypothetical protein